MKSKINCKRLPVFWLSLFWVANYVSANPATFVDSGQLLETGRSDAAALGDMDADGDLDVFIVTSGNNRGNKIWLNDGTGIFIDSGQSLRDFSGGSTSYDVGLKDLDGDVAE